MHDEIAELFRTSALIIAAVFPIVNPLGNAPIFLILTRGASSQDRATLSRKIAINGFILLVLSVLIGTSNAFLIERGRFFGKQALSILMLAPLVIPGVILGISILAFASRVAQFLDELFGVDWDFLRPGLPLSRPIGVCAEP